MPAPPETDSSEDAVHAEASGQPQAQHPRKAIWIASYPKSGNTWVRVFLHNLIRETGGGGEAQDINALHEVTVRESLAGRFAQRLGKRATEASPAEIARVRPLVQADIVQSAAGPVYIKTHNALANVDGFPTINLGVTLAAVYIVRNPLDVAISYAHHSGLTYDPVIAFMANSPGQLDADDRRVYEFLGSWSFHVASWMSVPNRPILLMRYEDMLSAPERSFGRLASFLRLKASADQLSRAIGKSSFSELACQEELHGFNERPKTAAKFFREGKAGQWRCALTKTQVQSVIAAHGPMMMRLGYLAEDCGV
jgi:hypothetical protein